MEKVYIGIDNGTTGSIGVLGLQTGNIATVPPTKKQQNYHKKAANITRIDYPNFFAWAASIKALAEIQGSKVFAVLEKPFTGMAHTAVLAGRTYEVEIIALELLEIPYETICSSDWQGTKNNRGLLPEGIKGSAQMKKASEDVGLRLFPELKTEIKKHGDADGLLIAEWARRKGI